MMGCCRGRRVWEVRGWSPARPSGVLMTVIIGGQQLVAIKDYKAG